MHSPCSPHREGDKGLPSPQHKVLHAGDPQLVGSVVGERGDIHVEILGLHLRLGLRLAERAAHLLIRVFPLVPGQGEPCVPTEPSRNSCMGYSSMGNSCSGQSLPGELLDGASLYGELLDGVSLYRELLHGAIPARGTPARGNPCMRNSWMGHPCPRPGTHSPRRMSGTWKETTASFCLTTKSTGWSFWFDRTLTDTRTPSVCGDRGR